MIYGSVCSGIEAATMAWRHLNSWQPAFYSEIADFPKAVLRHHHPQVPLHGDFTTIRADEYGPIDLLVGGTPCQSFSVAGLRGGLADERGNLALGYLRLAQRLRPRWLVWENVPGVLSSNGGRDFGSILGGLVELGYGFDWRVLDAQFFGVPQRRRRVFVVGHLGDWRRATAVLFERHSLSGNPAPRREARKDAAEDLAKCLNGKGGSGRIDGESETFIAHALRGEGFDASEDGTGRGVPLTLAIRGRGDSHDLEWRQDGTANAILTPNGGRAGIGVGAIAFSAKDHGADAGDIAPTLRAGGHRNSHANAGVMPAVAVDLQNVRTGGDIAGTLDTTRPSRGGGQALMSAMSVRRLTPRECERLQGFPDDYTLIEYRGKPAADGPRYKALGNSMAVPVMRWIGERINVINELG